MNEDKIQKPFLILFIVSFCFVGILLGVNVPFAYFLLLAYLSWLFSFKINLKGFYLLLFALAFFARFIYILLIQTPLESDFKLLFNSAVQISQGNYRFSLSLYFHDWAYQTGFVLYESAVVKLIGAANARFALKVLNALLGSGTCLLIYLMARNFVSEKASRFASLLSTWAIFPLTYVTVLSNQHISTFFLMLGLFLIVDKQTLKLRGFLRGLLSGFVLALGNVMRPEGMIFVCALSLFFLLRLIRPKEENRRSIMIKASLLVLIYFGTNALASGLIIQSGINKEGLRNNNPLWKLVTGLNAQYGGIMTQSDSDMVYGDHNYTQEERKALELEIIKDRLKMGPKKLISLLIAKQRFLWGGDSLIWSYRHILSENKPINILGYHLPVSEAIRILLGIHTLQMFILVALSVFGALYYNKTERSREQMIFYYILLITFAIYSLIEVQPRYIHLQQAVLFVTAALGIEGVITKFKVMINQ